MGLKLEHLAVILEGPRSDVILRGPQIFFFILLARIRAYQFSLKKLVERNLSSSVN